MNRGFTVVEIIVTLVVITILLGLGIVGIRSSLANARDTERESDIKTIATGLEERYKKGNPVATSTQVSQGSYPGFNEMIHIGGSYRSGFTPDTVAGGYLQTALPGTSESSFKNPSGNQVWNIVCVSACSPAEDQTQINTAFSNGSGGFADRYVYEPVDASGGICCCGDCRRFNLYWISETDTTSYKGIPGLKVYRSRHQ